MNDCRSLVESHYARSDLLDAILAALKASGKDVEHLQPADLGPVDEFHVRGREATVELVRRAAPHPGSRVLDVGSGLGGSARYLAETLGCRVTGIDVTREYVHTARALSERVGLADRVEFHCASALELPFPPATFDVAWTEHVQMNIADKERFYGEIARVLRPGGRLLFHDIFEGDDASLHLPVPWAAEASISFLARPERVREILEEIGMAVGEWEDCTARTLEWFADVVDQLTRSGPPPLGLHLLMGNQARTKFENMVRNLREGRVVVVQAVATKAS